MDIADVAIWISFIAAFVAVLNCAASWSQDNNEKKD